MFWIYTMWKITIISLHFVLIHEKAYYEKLQLKDQYIMSANFLQHLTIESLLLEITETMRERLEKEGKA